MKIREDFLHYLWKLKKIDFSDLTTTDGEPVSIIQSGTNNSDSGPDFFNAKVRISDTVWVGNIEIHVYASDWLKHNHQNDPAYNNVILHVVYDNDVNIKFNNGVNVPTIEIKDRIPKGYLRKYKLLKKNEGWIPCDSRILDINTLTVVNTLEKAIIDRLTQKTLRVRELFHAVNSDWNQTFYIFLSRYFGMKVNADAFEMLSKSIDYKIVLAEKDSLHKLEALLFGQAGFLNEEFEEEYPLSLQKSYQHLETKYNLNSIPISVWKFSKLRPANFPTIRIAQMASVLFKSENIFRQILEIEDLDKIKSLFKIEVSGYWLEHYKFGEKSTFKKKRFGKNAINILIINTIVPLLFFYGEYNNIEAYKSRAVELLSKIEPESNSIINAWKKLNIPVKSAYDSQALLQMKLNNCDSFKCLECPIGNEIMNN